MEAFISLFSQYNVPAAFLVNIELTLWSALFSTILGVILVMMRISPVASLRIVSGAYVELFKNLPLTIIMVFMVLGAYAQLKLSFSDTFATNFFLTVTAEVEPVTEHRRLPLRSSGPLMEVSSLRTSRS